MSQHEDFVETCNSLKNELNLAKKEREIARRDTKELSEELKKSEKIAIDLAERNGYLQVDLNNANAKIAEYQRLLDSNQNLWARDLERAVNNKEEEKKNLIEQIKQLQELNKSQSNIIQEYHESFKLVSAMLELKKEEV